MQLSFQHNQRTLELGLQMADTLRAGVQVLAETQADCMKALVGSRHWFRNAVTHQRRRDDVGPRLVQDHE